MYVEGSYFGDLEVLLNTRYLHIGRDGSAIVDSECQLQVIGGKELKGILKHFPDIKKVMKDIAKKRRGHHARGIEEAKKKYEEHKLKNKISNRNNQVPTAPPKNSNFQGGKNMLNQLYLQSKKGGLGYQRENSL